MNMEGKELVRVTTPYGQDPKWKEFLKVFEARPERHSREEAIERTFTRGA